MMASIAPGMLWVLVYLVAALATPLNVPPPYKPGNQAYEFNAVAITGGGYVTGIIAHPSEKGLMYARTDIGSSYRWSQQANKWIPLTDFVSEADSNLLGTESIALDSADPNKLYLAQGRYLSSNNSAFFVSNDRGETFDIYPAPFPMGSNELGRNNGERLAVNPFNPDELWMGTRNSGLWKSEDGAKTWSNVTSIPNAFANSIGITTVIFDEQHNGTMYISATAPGGLFYTNDHGATWKPIAGQPSSWKGSKGAAAGLAPQSIAPQPMKAALASNGVLYITYGDSPGPYGVDFGAVYSYNTYTKKWRDITPSASNTFPAPYGPQAFPGGGYCGLSVSSHDANTLVITSLDRDPGPAIDSLYLSINGGQTWKDVSQLSTPNRESVGGFWGHPITDAVLDNGTAVPWLNFDWSERWGGYGAPSPIHGLTKFGWWMSALLMSPWDSQQVMYGTGATIWASNNLLSAIKSNSAPRWFVQAQGIEETVCLAMISPISGVHLFSGLGDINGFRHEDLDVPQPMLALPVSSNLNSLDWAGKKPDVIVRVGVNGLNNTAATGCHLGAYSQDGGIEWTPFATCIPPLSNEDSDSGVIAVDASGEYVIWTWASSSLEGSNPTLNNSGPYYSSNMGKVWASPNGLNLQTPNISADRIQPKTFYSYTLGVWYISTNGGRSYKVSQGYDIGLPNTPDSGAVPIVNFAKAGHVYLSLGSEGIFETVDFGESWHKVSSRGVNPSLFTIGSPKPGDTVPALYIWGSVSPSSTVGLYRSDDNGASWVRVNDESHQYGGPTLLQGDPRVYGRVYIGTSGRGIVRADLVNVPKAQGNMPGTGGI